MKKNKDELLKSRTFRTTNQEYKTIQERHKKYNSGKKKTVSQGRWITSTLMGKDPIEFAK